MSQFCMPSLGADMDSALLAEWKVKAGDRVTKGQIIAEVETSKGVIEIEVFEDGVVEQLLVDTETECDVGTPLAMIRTEGELSEPVEKPNTVESKATEPPPAITVPAAEPEKQVSARVMASPAARRKAKEYGIALEELSDKQGIIHLKDVMAAKKTASPLPQGDAMRQAIAAAMSRSNAEIPHYYLSTSVNMSPALRWLSNENSTKTIKDRILPAALLIHAAVQVLKEVPELNGFWRDGTHHISEAIHPGIAIALRKGGLITPALLDADKQNLDQTMRSLSDLIARTRAGKLRSSELMQQTVTITNLGDLGVDKVYGVIYPPQIALVGFGKISDSPWAEGDALCVRKVMQVTLAGDHRATDGRTGALFLDKLKNYLENMEKQ